MATLLAPATSERCYTGPVEVAVAEVLREIYRLRARVWAATGKVRPGAFGPQGWHDEFDGEATHWAIFDDGGSVVAAARLTLHERVADLEESEAYLRYCRGVTGPIAAPARVVVCPKAQGQGLAQRLLAAQDELALAAGARVALRQASPQMVPLLKRRGWRIVGLGPRDARISDVQFQVARLDFCF